MSLFGNLPPPTSHLRPKQEAKDDEYKPQPLSAEAPHGGHSEANPEGGPDGHDDRPDKRRRVDSSGGGGLSSDQVTAALAKIASHISNPDKFPKASGLLRQLLDSGALSPVHREPLFAAIKAAFADLDAASEPGLRRDYMKLIHSLDKRAEQLLSRAQLAQLSVYRLVGFTQNEMHTDDSFVFNKVLGRIKEAVAALPPADEEDEEALAELQGVSSSDSDSDDDGGAVGDRGDRGDGQDGEDQQGGGAGRRSRWHTDDDAGAAAAGPSARGADASANGGGAADGGGDGDEYDEADPFGLDRLIPAPEPAPPPPPPAAAAEPKAQRGGGGAAAAAGSAWTAAQALVMRRQALIECLITARGFHKTPWARTSVELLVEHYAKHRDRFAASQQLAVEEMVRFVRSARAARPTGPSQKEINRDTTSFERARSEWSKVAVSARGKVGAQGDAKTQNWLG